MKKEEKDQWVFMAYETKEDYPHSPYFYKVFYDHSEMKTFSAEYGYE